MLLDASAAVSDGCAPGVTRTPGTQFRKLLLYPPELRGRPVIPNACESPVYVAQAPL